MVPSYLLHLGILCAAYIVAVWSLDLLVGRIGVFSMAHGAFLGVGAYSYAIASTRLGIHPGLALGLASGISLLFGAIAARPIARLRSDQAMLFTIAIQGVVTTLLFNLGPLTGGSLGIAGIKAPAVFAWAGWLDSQAIVAGGLLVGALILFHFIHRSAPGLAMRAVGEDGILASSVGVNAERVRALAFALSGATAGFAGAFLAGYLTFIDPNSFSLSDSIFLVTALLVGGSGNLRGPALGILLVVLLPELLRGVAVPAAVAANAQRVLFAAALILLMRFRPRGLAGEVASR